MTTEVNDCALLAGVQCVGAVLYPVLTGYIYDARTFMIVTKVTKTGVRLVPLQHTDVILSKDGYISKLERTPIIPNTLPVNEDSILARVDIWQGYDGSADAYASCGPKNQLKRWGLYDPSTPYIVNSTTW